MVLLVECWTSHARKQTALQTDLDMQPSTFKSFPNRPIVIGVVTQAW